MPRWPTVFSTSTAAADGRKEFYVKAKLVVIIVLVVLVGILLIQNSQRVTFSLFFWSVQVSQLLLVLIMLGLGFLGGWLTATFTRKDP